MRRIGLQTEFVASFGLVMLAATLILAIVLLKAGQVRLRSVLGPALWAEAQSSVSPRRSIVPGTQWWRLFGDPATPGSGANYGDLDPQSLDLAKRARQQGKGLLELGAPWQPIRFAAPLEGRRGVAVARLSRTASFHLRGLPLAVACAVLLFDVAIFTAFGALQLRHRVALPMRRLAVASQRVAAGAFDVRLGTQGPREVGDVAQAFNEMSEALCLRTRSLEQAVTELRSSNAALRSARVELDRRERLAAVGRLAAGVCHEVGNPLGALLAFLSLADRDPDLPETARGHLRRASEQGLRVRRILRQLQQYSHPSPAERIPLNLAAVAAESAELVSAQRAYRGVRIAVEEAPDTPSALGDPGLVGQILLNLFLNAADAMDDAVGEICVRVRPSALREPGPGEAVAAEPPPDDAAVECLVLDTGGGIAARDRGRIFEPFFSTKRAGAGTGLGLANSQRFAEQLGGRLEFADPAPGYRTAFSLRLPRGHPATRCGVRTPLRPRIAEKEADARAEKPGGLWPCGTQLAKLNSRDEIP